jgi:hypothetical protein
MLGAVSTSRLGCQFDRFLYASVGDDTNGMPLTVLSALARMNVDPWEEASKLTQLPKESAVTQLASLLGALRNAPVAGLDPARIAPPLIALLPCPRDRAPLMLKALAQAVPTKHPAAVSTVLTVLTYVISMLVVQWLMGSHQAPKQIQAPPTSAPAIESPSAPTSSEGPQSPLR